MIFSKIKSLSVTSRWLSQENSYTTTTCATYIINSPDVDCKAFGSTFIMQLDPISMAELYSYLLSYEKWIDLHEGGDSSSTNVMTKNDKCGGWIDQVPMANVIGMNFTHACCSIYSSYHIRNLFSNNILHVPQAKKTIASVSSLHLHLRQFCFLEFHPKFFLIKDQATKTTLLNEIC